MKKYASVRQLAERYDVSDRTIWRWSDPKVGVLPPPEQIGGATRWDLEQIDKLDAQRKERGAA